MIEPPSLNIELAGIMSCAENDSNEGRIPFACPLSIVVNY